MTRRRRNDFTRGKQNRILERDNWTCRYCDFPADTVDHITPLSYTERSDDENLVAACRRCNILAADMFFTSADEKREWLLHRRRREITKGTPALSPTTSEPRICDLSLPTDQRHLAPAEYFAAKRRQRGRSQDGQVPRHQP